MPVSFVWFALLACSTNERDAQTGSCSARCTTVTTSPARGAIVRPTATVTVAIEPADRAFQAELFGPDGDPIGGVVGSGTLDLVLTTNTLPEGELELVVRSSCDPAPAETCNEETVGFTVSVDGPTTPGTRPTRGYDVIEVAPEPMVDVLLVVDDSCSMIDKQLMLMEEIPSFMSFFLGSGLDYHIGAITTSPGSEALRRSNGVSWIDPNTPDAVQVFSNMTRVGTGGDPDAQAFTTSRAAIDAGDGGVNDGFTRDSANLVVVVVSDSDDKGRTSADEYVRWIEGLGRPEVSFIPIAPTDGLDVATKYFEAASALGSPSYDLDDFGASVLEGIGLQSAGLQRVFCTSEPAAPGSLEVEVHIDRAGGVVAAFDEGDDWVEVPGEGSTCIEFLEYIPEPGSEVHLRYDPA